MRSTGVIAVEISDDSTQDIGERTRAGGAETLACDAAVAEFAVAVGSRGVLTGSVISTGSDTGAVHDWDELRSGNTVSSGQIIDRQRGGADDHLDPPPGVRVHTSVSPLRFNSALATACGQTRIKRVTISDSLGG